MRALVYLGPRQMDLQEVSAPEPDEDEVVVRTSAAAICGSDLHGFREASPRRIPPLIMGHEAVGRIAVVGSGVEPSRVGERVVLKPLLACGTCEPCTEGRANLCVNGRLVGRDLAGAFAERFAVPSSCAVTIGEEIPDDLATLVEPLANAVHVTSRSVRKDDDVLVIGAGPIGALMARMAREHGAGRVLTTDPIAVRREVARRQGAVPLESADPAAEVLETTGGRGVDVVIDAAGFEATWEVGLRAVRPGGRVEAVGLGAPAGQVDFFAIAGREITVTGSFAWTDDDFVRATRLIQTGAIDTEGWFTSVPLAEGQRAFEELVDTSAHFKVVLIP